MFTYCTVAYRTVVLRHIASYDWCYQQCRRSFAIIKSCAPPPPHTLAINRQSNLRRNVRYVEVKAIVYDGILFENTHKLSLVSGCGSIRCIYMQLCGGYLRVFNGSWNVYVRSLLATNVSAFTLRVRQARPSAKLKS